MDHATNPEQTGDRTEARNILTILTKIYLFIYNLILFLGYLWVFSSMTFILVLGGKEFIFLTFKLHWTIMFTCQILAVFEVLNPALGLVNTAVFPAFVQVSNNRMRYVPDIR